MNTLDLINELNELSPYGINISSSDYMSNIIDASIESLKNYKTKQWRVTAIFNPNFLDISYSAYHEDLNIALKEVIDWLKENLS